ncbi:uncharacterized protein [Triticum aestivum]|uniref:uncharacterized protein n=1 Tax=Triticum aestivum TaxID=4565 RepID=UPI001D00A9AD|nr:uncharacterized protein LOC123148344 [Triticum aestivum]
MARAAVQRSAGRCESFRGRVDDDVLPFLVHSAPSLRSLHVTRLHDISSERLISVVAKKLPLLEELVLSHGLIQEGSLVALAHECPRLRVLDTGRCVTLCPIDRASRNRLRGWPLFCREPRQQVSSYWVQMRGQQDGSI